MGQMLNDIKKFYNDKSKETPQKIEQSESEHNSPLKNFITNSPPSMRSSNTNNGFLVTLGKDCQPTKDSNRISEASNRQENDQMMIGP